MRIRHAADVIDGAPRALNDSGVAKKPAPASAPAAVELEDFKRWLGISMSSPASQARIPAKLELRGSGCLAEMIEAVREALLACLEGLEDCNARTRRHWHQTGASRRSGYLSEPDREKTALQRETESWGEKIRWLQELRLCLEHERALCNSLPSRDRAWPNYLCD